MDTTVRTFHAKCLMLWNTYKCPVCHYIKHPNLIRDSTCMKCDATNSLWFCIICAHVGCGREVQAHALQHYKETAHKYAMNLKAFNVWDYKLKKVLHNLNGFVAEDEKLYNFHSYFQEPDKTACSCAVCRHFRAPKLFKHPVCMKCGESQSGSLWICLFCSHIGCGRFHNRHALEHYCKTKHSYSMQLDNFSIWDYKEHRYLHRQLHEPVLKSEIVEDEGEDLKDNFGERADRLQREWYEFYKLKKFNKTMTAIDENLLPLIDEKMVLEKTLNEHDAKLKELLNQFAGNRENGSIENNLNANNVHMKNIKSEEVQDYVKTEMLQENSVLYNNCNNKEVLSPAKIPKNFKKSKFISLIILGLFVYHSFMFVLQKLAQNIMNLM